MNSLFEYILVVLSISTGLILLSDRFFWRKSRKTKVGEKTLPWAVDYAKGLFPIFIIVLVLRAFIVDIFVIPSGSMLPTLKIGDFVWVNKYTYGLRLPIFHTLVFPGKPVARGDVMVFRYPVNPKLLFIKRVIGLPGDTISYENKKLTINGKAVPVLMKGEETHEEDGERLIYTKLMELLPEGPHKIFQRETDGRQPKITWQIPKGQYFMMGDNRDDSDDSRFWGMVRENDIVGKAFMVVLSWDKKSHWFRERIFVGI